MQQIRHTIFQPIERKINKIKPATDVIGITQRKKKRTPISNGYLVQKFQTITLPSGIQELLQIALLCIDGQTAVAKHAPPNHHQDQH